MLSRLRINNVALITNLELEFCERLNILSGETGAGKSIIVDSLMLLLGARYDKTLLRYGADFGFVEGVFDSTESSNAALKELGFDEDDAIIVNRKFYLDGRNEIRINGRAATTSMLKQIMTTLVDIYGQNEHQSLAKTNEHLRILDYYVRHKTINIREKLLLKYNEFKNVIKQLNELGEAEERERNIGLLRFQIEEIDKTKIKKDEEQELISRRKMISSAEKINDALALIVNNILESEETVPASELIDSALKACGSISDIGNVYEELYERLNSVSIELSDIAETAMSEIENLNFDFDELDKLEKRLDVLRSLKRKYGDYEKMLLFKASAEEQLNKLENCDELYEKLFNQRKQLVAELYALSKELSDMRRKGAKEFEVKIISQLADLGMKDSIFEIDFAELPKLEDCENFITANGMDKTEFFLSPNVGQPLKPLIKIISGGEMSRFMLALKVVSSETDDIGTMIFDEIDAGISGKIGQEVAKKLAEISRRHQILCVTHLSQIASMADNHYLINKNVQDGQTITTVNLLNDNEVVEEISRLSGAKDISAQSKDNAYEMKKWSNAYKDKIK